MAKYDWLDALWALTDIDSRIGMLALVPANSTSENRQKVVQKLTEMIAKLEAERSRWNGGLLQSVSVSLSSSQDRPTLSVALHESSEDSPAIVRLRGDK